MARGLPLDFDITIYANTDFRREFRWLPDGTTPIDFTGWSATMLIGQPRNVADLSLSTANGEIILGSDGKIIIALEPSRTRLLKTSATWYNLDLTQPDGFVRRFLRGRVTVVIDVVQTV